MILRDNIACLSKEILLRLCARAGASAGTLHLRGLPWIWGKWNSALSAARAFLLAGVLLVDGALFEELRGVAKVGGGH